MFYPMKFKPIYKEMIWGGQALKTVFNRTLPSDQVGESWDISCRNYDMSQIMNGAFAGCLFEEVIEKDKWGFLGHCCDGGFPLLLKLLSTGDNLSVQVHPDDGYARRVEHLPRGKAEAWYIVEAPPESKMVFGLKDGCTKEQFQEAIHSNKIEECLRSVPVRKGDVFFVPPGTVHAPIKGIVCVEIQQNADITYRLYDYNRVGLDGRRRELHQEKAMDVINFCRRPYPSPVKGLETIQKEYSSTYYIGSSAFCFLKHEITGRFKLQKDENFFCLLTCIFGNGDIVYNDAATDIREGESVFIPAALTNVCISGNCTMLCFYVPRNEDDFIAPLKQYGYSEEEIRQNIVLDF